MKFEWPTELAQRENGDFYERRLTVFEIALRFMLDPLYFILSWLFRFVEFVVVAFLDGLGEILMAITRTMEFLERKYSTGKDKKAPYEPPYDSEFEDFVKRIKDLIIENHYRGIVAIQIQARMEHLFPNGFPETMFAFPVKIVHGFRATSSDFALEVEWPDGSIIDASGVRIPKHRTIPPIDSDYSEPIVKPHVGRK